MNRKRIKERLQMFEHKCIPICFAKNIMRIGKQRIMNLDLCCIHLKQVK